jgi:beta-glucanase (GH16 family)
MTRRISATTLVLCLITAQLMTIESYTSVHAQTPTQNPIQNQLTQNEIAKSEVSPWQLQWSDEFEVDGLPDAAKWNYEDGLVRNKEPQYYTRRMENARVEGGMLVIEGRKEQFPNPKYRAGSENWKEQQPFAPYTSASLNTQGKISWQYGRLEVRAKIPQGKGMWPAIWTLGDAIGQVGWPKCGEIDIMEFVGKEPNKVHGTTHFSVDDKHRSKGKALTVERPFDDFHIYAVEWFPDRIDFYFDQNKFHTFNLDEAGVGPENPFRKPHYLLLNLAIGGTWGGEVDETVLPQKYLVDYVRVYRHNTLTDK